MQNSSALCRVVFTFGVVIKRHPQKRLLKLLRSFRLPQMRNRIPMFRSIVLSICLASTLTACWRDETLTGYGAADRAWILQKINGVDFPAKATLTFPAKGQIAGQAPCNSFHGQQTAPYPWFQVEQIATTRRACPEMKQEMQFLTSLAEMRETEVAGSVLILRNEDGGEMLFKADD